MTVTNSSASISAQKEFTLVEYGEMIHAELAYLETTIQVFATPEEVLAEARKVGLIEEFYEPKYRDEVYLPGGRVVSFRDWWDNLDWELREEIFDSLFRFWKRAGIKNRYIVS